MKLSADQHSALETYFCAVKQRDRYISPEGQQAAENNVAFRLAECKRLGMTHEQGLPEHPCGITELNPEQLATYSAHEVANLADIDWHAVRNEGHRRHSVAVKRLASLQRQLAKVTLELAEAEMIVATAEMEAQKQN